MKKEQYPIATVFCYTDTKANGLSVLRFNSADGQIEVDNYISEILEVLKVCDGENPRSEIVKKLDSFFDDKKTDTIIDWLFSKRLIVDYKNQSDLVHGIFTSSFNSEEISKNRPEDIQSIFDYHLVLFKSSNEFEAGTYKLNRKSKKFEKIDAQLGLDGVTNALNSAFRINDNSCILIISANVNKLAITHGNMAYKMTLTELGKIISKLSVKANQSKSAEICAYDNFNQKYFIRKLKLQKKNSFLLSVVVQTPLDNNLDGFSGSFDEVVTKLMENTSLAKILPHEILLTKYSLGGAEIPREFAFAPYPTNGQNKVSRISSASAYGCGAGQTTSEAKLKAMAEAFERVTAEKLRYDHRDKCENLSSNQILLDQFMTVQHKYKNADLADFDPKAKIEWVKGLRLLDSSDCLIPIELVNYPVSYQNLKRNPIYRTNSSGMAAHTDRDQAIMSGILELIERDALMVTWYSKKNVHSFTPAEIPLRIKDRYDILSRNGVKITFIDLTLDLVPVTLCILSSDSRKPYLSVGACADFNHEETLIKAYNEAEFSFLSWRGVKLKSIKAEDVRSVRDHAHLYFNKGNWKEISWLLNAKNVDIPPANKIFTPSELIKAVDPIVVEMHPATKNLPLWVIRVLSETLLPINFGFGTEHYNHKRINDLGLKWERDYPSFPHFFP